MPANKLAALPAIRYAPSTHGTFAKSACGLLKNDSSPRKRPYGPRINCRVDLSIILGLYRKFCWLSSYHRSFCSCARQGSKLPQLLFQLLHRLEDRPLRRVCSPLCRFSIICSVWSRATPTRITAIGPKTDRSLESSRLFSIASTYRIGLGSKKACHRENYLI